MNPLLLMFLMLPLELFPPSQAPVHMLLYQDMRPVARIELRAEGPANGMFHLQIQHSGQEQENYQLERLRRRTSQYTVYASDGSVEIIDMHPFARAVPHDFDRWLGSAGGTLPLVLEDMQPAESAESEEALDVEQIDGIIDPAEDQQDMDFAEQAALAEGSPEEGNSESEAGLAGSGVADSLYPAGDIEIDFLENAILIRYPAQNWMLLIPLDDGWEL